MSQPIETTREQLPKIKLSCLVVGALGIILIFGIFAQAVPLAGIVVAPVAIVAGLHIARKSEDPVTRGLGAGAVAGGVALLVVSLIMLLWVT